MEKENYKHTIRIWVKLKIDSYACDSGTRLPSSCCTGLLVFFLFPLFFFLFRVFSVQDFFGFDPPFCFSFFFRTAFEHQESQASSTLLNGIPICGIQKGIAATLQL